MKALKDIEPVAAGPGYEVGTNTIYEKKLMLQVAAAVIRKAQKKRPGITGQDIGKMTEKEFLSLLHE